MILDDTITITINPNNFKYYKNLNYIFEKVGDIITIDITHLSKGSDMKINCKCDICSIHTKVIYKNYIRHTDSLKQPYHCSKCKDLKMVNTNLTRYQTKYVLSSDIIREKAKMSIVEIYGVENISSSEEIKQRKREDSLVKWGYESPLSSPIVRKKIGDTNLKKYDTIYPFLSDQYKQLKKDNHTKYMKDKVISNYRLDISNFEILEYDSGIFHILDKRYDEIFEIKRKHLYDRIRLDTEISALKSPIGNMSGYQQDMVRWLASKDIEFVVNDRSVLDGQELDIFIPTMDIAIEFNGLYWHSDKFKDKRYHLRKKLTCIEKEIDLMHIWEDEWIEKRDIIKNIVSNRLNIIKKQDIVDFSISHIYQIDTIKYFMDKNYIKGYFEADINIALYDEQSEIVAMMLVDRDEYDSMIFHIRSLTTKINNSHKNLEEELLSYFISNHNHGILYAYHDFRLFDDNIYKNSGFSVVKTSEPMIYENNRYTIYDCGVIVYKLDI